MDQDTRLTISMRQTGVGTLLGIASCDIRVGLDCSRRGQGLALSRYWILGAFITALVSKRCMGRRVAMQSLGILEGTLKTRTDTHLKRPKFLKNIDNCSNSTATDEVIQSTNRNVL